MHFRGGLRVLLRSCVVLIRFQVANHRSIRDEQELSLVASPLSERAESLFHAERYGFDLLCVAALYGANASGKSTVFHGLSFMRAAVVNSQRVWPPDGGIPRVPFALDNTVGGVPSRFAVDLLLDGVRYEYGFVVDSVRVLEEWLYAYPKGRRQEWFTRDASRKAEFAFSRLFPGENQLISTLTRPNSLYLSAAAQNNHPMVGVLYRWFANALSVADVDTRGSVFPTLIEMCRHEPLRRRIVDLLRAADLGIADVELYDEDATTGIKRFLRRFEGEPLTLDPGTFRQEGGEVGFTRIRFLHRAGEAASAAPLPFEHESAGTRALFVLAGEVVLALVHGRTVLVDELDRSLHPYIATQIVNIFNDPESNPRGAQLIFNTHDTNLLDTSILRRDQIWFTEKGDDGATRLFPLTDFRARKYENLERGYLQGRYGAVPSIRTPEFLRRVGG
jgi:hypothetical protein